jgi:hypothetical protein
VIVICICLKSDWSSIATLLSRWSFLRAAQMIAA